MNLDSLVATTEGIRGLLFQPEKRAPLIAAGFDWDGFEQKHGDLQSADVGFQRACFPVKLAADAASRAGAILGGLQSDLTQLRALAPTVFTGPDQLDALIACTVPDGTPHAELSEVDPADVHVIPLQDMGPDIVGSELPHISRMVHAQAVYLFGNELRDDELSVVSFSRLTKLRTLALSGNELLRFPDVTGLTRLESLNLMDNPMLRHLPGELAEMTGLRLLDLRRTGVAEGGDHSAIRSALPSCDVRF